MHLAGIPISDESIVELVRFLRESGYIDVADRLDTALELETKILGLTIPEREAILRALDDPPDGLAELRGVLLKEHVGRTASGLA